ncbi:hypothetical protein D3C75_1293440 [compost metagenome]
MNHKLAWSVVLGFQVIHKTGQAADHQRSGSRVLNQGQRMVGILLAVDLNNLLARQSGDVLQGFFNHD